MSEIVERPVENTDRELWRETEGDYYANSIHVTEQGAIGINVGGHVIVKPLAEWHRAEAELLKATEALRAIIGNANESPRFGPFDQIDNHGQHYQSEAFFRALETGRKLLADRPHFRVGEKE